MKPSDLPIEETLRFLERALPTAPARVLEVGAGDGAVSMALAGRGYDLTALDETLDRRDDPGADRVRWVEADFRHYDPEEDPYDVVLFVRSLHHLAPIEGALDRARALLRPGGLLVAEEFAYDRVNLPTARWFYDLDSILVAAGMVVASGASAPEGNPLGRWRREHEQDPPLATGHAMLAAARERFELAPVEEAPYLYRDFCARLAESERGLAAGRIIFEIERRMIRERDLAASGLRLVGRVAG